MLPQGRHQVVIEERGATEAMCHIQWWRLALILRGYADGVDGLTRGDLDVVDLVVHIRQHPHQLEQLVLAAVSIVVERQIEIINPVFDRVDWLIVCDFWIRSEHLQ